MQTQNVTKNAAVAAIFGQPVHRGSEKEFLVWQHEVNEAASGYPGFVGSEIAAPNNAHSDWVVIYRFDSVANLHAWLDSSTRQEQLAIGKQYFDGTPTQQIVGGTSTATSLQRERAGSSRSRSRPTTPRAACSTSTTPAATARSRSTSTAPIPAPARSTRARAATCSRSGTRTSSTGADC